MRTAFAEQQHAKSVPDLNSLSYNSLTEHGQMLGVADALRSVFGLYGLRPFTVHFRPETVRFGGKSGSRPNDGQQEWTVNMRVGLAR